MTAHPASEATTRADEVIVALFVDQDTAERAIAELREAGLPEDDILVAKRSEMPAVVPGHPGGSVAQGAGEGALSGGAVGGVLGVLGFQLLPGVGPTVVGGLAGALAGGAVLGAVIGSCIGALVAIGPSPRQTEVGEPAGGTLVTVLTDGHAVKAPTILGLLSKKMERRNLPSFNYFGPDRRAAGWA